MTPSKMFVYSVNGETFEDTVPFGEAWKKAKEAAKNDHTFITRQVICGNTITNEFYAEGVFLNERFFTKDAVHVF